MMANIAIMSVADSETRDVKVDAFNIMSVLTFLCSAPGQERQECQEDRLGLVQGMPETPIDIQNLINKLLSMIKLVYVFLLDWRFFM
jgi:hypothetical protein